MNSSIQLSRSGNKHLENVGKMFGKLFNDEQLSDVILCCEDGCIRAHKVILASCSPYFHKIFTETDVCGDLSIVIMHEVPFQHLQDLVELIYKGSVEVLSESLDALYELAMELQLSGISGILSEFINEKDQEPSAEVVTPVLTPIVNTIDEDEEEEEESPKAPELVQKSPSNDEESPLPFIISHVCTVPLQRCAFVANEENEYEPEENKIEIVEHEINVEESTGEENNNKNYKQTSETLKNNEVSHRYNTRLKDLKRVAVEFKGSNSKRTKKSSDPLVINNKNITLSDEEEESAKSLELDENYSPSNNEEHEVTHRVTHSGERPHACTQCDKTFSRNDKLKEHVRFVHDKEVKKWKCEKCHKSFKCRWDLTGHEVTHSGERPLPCTQCDKTFSRRFNLKEHVRFVHNKMVKKWKCEKCHMRFWKRSYLTRHEVTHSGERPHACTQCDKTFSRDDKLKDHVRFVHEKEVKKWNCEKCHLSFMWRSYLTRHEVKHSYEQRPLACTQCNRFFSREDRLKVHMRFRHNKAQVKRWKCEQCDVSFYRLTDLNHHKFMAGHTDEPPHATNQGRLTNPETNTYKLRDRVRKAHQHYDETLSDDELIGN